MLFHTYVFWTFFAIVALFYARLPHRGQNLLLLVAGYIFYGWWDWRFLLLIALSTVVDYVIGNRIHATLGDKGRRRWLTASLVFNITLLGIFKYLGFAVAQAGSLAAWLGYQGPWWVPQVILPVGISFYTFQSLAYTIDLYRRRIIPARSLFSYATYVSFFPQLLAGPIERPGRLLQQVQEPRGRFDDTRLREGLYLILTGLFKKVIIADNFALVVDAVFAGPASGLSGWEVLVGVYAFAFQIYGDFSGYSSIAQGLARWLGFSLMDNFRQPYFARSPQEFWTRWHISLSSWLRDYLYIPLGGNRGSPLFTARNLMLTMLIGGLWHGAAWTFIAWGAVHGVWLVIHRHLSRTAEAKKDAWWLGGIKMACTFHLVCLTWLLFRAQSMSQAGEMLYRLGQDWSFTPLTAYTLGMLATIASPLLLFEFWVEKKGDLLALTRIHWLLRAAVYALLILYMLYLTPERSSEFIYFQF